MYMYDSRGANTAIKPLSKLVLTYNFVDYENHINGQKSQEF